MTWFERHLNWTWAIVVILSQILASLDIIYLHTLFIYLVAFFGGIYGTAVWILWRKSRSGFWLLIPFLGLSIPTASAVSNVLYLAGQGQLAAAAGGSMGVGTVLALLIGLWVLSGFKNKRVALKEKVKEIISDNDSISCAEIAKRLDIDEGLVCSLCKEIKKGSV